MAKKKATKSKSDAGGAEQVAAPPSNPARDAGRAWNSRVFRAVFERPWALRPEKLAAIAEVVERHALGVKLDAEEIRVQLEAQALPDAREETPLAARSGAVAVINIFGIMAQRMNMILDMSGGVSTELVAKAFRSALEDTAVWAIVLNIDSPGGDVYGVRELADLIRAGRTRKRIVAIANSEAASGAYWIASAASEFVVTPGGETGSIGVWAMHVDLSARDEKDGLSRTLISAGKYKVEGNPYEPLGKEAEAEFQKIVDEYHAMFLEGVAANRTRPGSEVTAETVEEGFGQGRIFRAAEAVRRGLADRVATFDEVVTGLLSERAAADQVRGARRVLDERERLRGKKI